MAGLTAVIPSKRARNLVACVRALRLAESDLRIIVVDDGARSELARTGLSIDDVDWVGGIRPFVFARNVNLGIAAADTDDVLLMNDDAEWAHGRPSDLARVAREGGWWLLAPGVVGHVGEGQQRWRQRHDPAEVEKVCFVSVLIPRTTIKWVGTLDERFTAYGYEDDDYCRRVRLAGGRCGVWDGCAVLHGRLPSTYRRTTTELLRGKRIYEEKWGACKSSA